MLIKRNIQEKIENDLWKKKIVIIYGTRQIGKTTLVNQILTSLRDGAMSSLTIVQVTLSSRPKVRRLPERVPPSQDQEPAV